MRSLALALILGIAPPVATQDPSDETPTLSMDGTIAEPSAHGPTPIGVTLDKIDSFPEEYEGRELTIVGVSVDGDLSRTGDDAFAVNLKDLATEKWVFSTAYGDGINFFVSKAMAHDLLDYIKGGYMTGANVTFTVRKVKKGSSALWVGCITNVDLLNRGGGLYKRITGEPATFAGQ